MATLADVLAANAARAAAFRGAPFFQLLTEAALQDEGKRRVLLACVQRFSTNFQRLMFLRQGLCIEPTFQEVFAKHFAEEVGHDALLASGSGVPPIRDTLFEAILAWFNYQMIVQGNAERTVLMHLVLEEAGDYFHGVAAGRLKPYVASPYFDTHAELDAGHASLGAQLLEGESSRTYERLLQVLAEGWDMMGAAVERTRQLMEASASPSA